MLADFPPRGKEKELNEMFWNNLFDLPGPRRPNPEPTPASKFTGQLVRGNLEIQTAYFTIRNVRRFFSRSPRGLVNRRSDYLGFVVHAYLNEIYILEQRMCAYLKKLPKDAAKNSEVRNNLEKIRPDLLKVVKDAFKGINGTRGAHVHEQRFCDEGIDRLRTFELLNGFPKHFPPLEHFLQV